MAMTELEKLDAGLPYDFMDPEVDGRKLHALSCAQKLNAIPMQNAAEREAAVRELFGSCGKHPTVLRSLIATTVSIFMWVMSSSRTTTSRSSI